jgi:hypothetical protein
MHVRMVQAEVEEAIREWLQRRGIEASKNEIEFRIKVVLQTNHQRAYGNGELIQGPVIVDVLGIELPPKEGPYR